MENALVFLKPDAVIRRYVGAGTIKEFLDAEFKIIYFGEEHPPKEFFATKHYSQHKGKFFYDWLLDYVTSSAILVLILTGDDIINKIRALLGHTIPENADCDSIRGKYGIFRGINVAHAPDNSENGKRELEIWKDIIKVQENYAYAREAEAYIAKYIDFPMIECVEYRETLKQQMNNEINENEAKSIFINLLSKESDFDHETISQFAEIMIKSV